MDKSRAGPQAILERGQGSGDWVAVRADLPSASPQGGTPFSAATADFSHKKALRPSRTHSRPLQLSSTLRSSIQKRGG